MITAKVVADSLNEHGDRITTMEVVFPRFILAELNTHRMFSRNSASSRAIPFEKMVKMVQENPFIPIAWQKQHKGMQGTEYWLDNEIIEGVTTYDEASGRYDLPLTVIDRNTDDWLCARDEAINAAKNLYDTGVTKQLCNRLLEPFMWHKVLITATEWENFFALRCPQYTTSTGRVYRSKKDYWKGNPPNSSTNLGNELGWLSINKGQAEIHMMALAEAMWDEFQSSVPEELQPGEWHIPYGDDIDDSVILDWVTGIGGTIEDYDTAMQFEKVKIAVARCARVSYTTVGEEDKAINYGKDLKLHDRLLESGHYSPFEHCARAMSMNEYIGYCKGINMPEVPVDERHEKKTGFHTEHGRCKNFRGFIQYRAMIEGGKS